MDKLNAFIKTGLSWVEKIFHLLTELELSAPAISSKNKKKMGANKLEKEKKMQLEALQELLDGNFINEKQYNLKAEEIKKQT